MSLLAMLLIILVAAEIFTNALEHLGEKLRISDGVTGSIFAAVGTALPETSVPIIALLAGTANQHTNEEIGVGAILGAPLMLSTLSISLMALSVLKTRGATGHLRPEKTGLIRDLNFFILSFSFSIGALFVPHSRIEVRGALGLVMLLTYFIYLYLTIRSSKSLVEDGHATEADSPMLLNRLGFPNNFLVILLQLSIGLTMLVAGAKGFISGVQAASLILGVSPLLLSLIVIPIATELPEKVNSILWIRKGKDTLAFGNITGAMVFQGTLLPAIGIMLTPWTPRPEVSAGLIITMVASVWVRFIISLGAIRVWHLWVNGILYFVYLLIVLN